MPYFIPPFMCDEKKLTLENAFGKIMSSLQKIFTMN